MFLRILLRGKHDGVSLARGKGTGWIDYGRGKWEPEERESDFDFLWRAQSPGRAVSGRKRFRLNPGQQGRTTSIENPLK